MFFVTQFYFVKSVFPHSHFFISFSSVKASGKYRFSHFGNELNLMEVKSFSIATTQKATLCAVYVYCTNHRNHVKQSDCKQGVPSQNKKKACLSFHEMFR